MRPTRTLASMATTLDTIIIGAGWSGAVAAQTLTKAGRSVLVLEARERLGGRAQTFQPGAGQAGIDLGCSWIHGYNEGNPAREIAKANGVTAHLPKPASGPVYGPDGLVPEEEAASLRQSLGDTLTTAHASSKSSSTSIDPSTPLSTSVQPTPFARTLEVGLGVPLERASLKWAGWESGFGGSDAAPEGGYQSLVTKVLESSGAEIKTKQHVSCITLLESGDVQVETQGGEKYTARTALCTIPLGVLKAHAPTFNPALPERKLETIERVHVGTLEKLLLSYDQAWWPSSDQVGSMTFLPTSSSSASPSSIKEILDQATLVVASFAGPALPNPQPALLIYLSATPASALASLKATTQDVANAMHALLSTRLGVTNAPKPAKAALTNWGSDVYSCGATTTPNVITPKGQVERTPLDFVELGKAIWQGRLGFAGEHTDPDHRGSVAGAVISGEREGVRIQRYLGLLDTQAAAKA